MTGNFNFARVVASGGGARSPSWYSWCLCARVAPIGCISTAVQVGHRQLDVLAPPRIGQVPFHKCAQAQMLIQHAPTSGHLESTRYHPLLLFKREGDCLAAKLRPGNVHRTESWEELLLPKIEPATAAGQGHRSSVPTKRLALNTRLGFFVCRAPGVGASRNHDSKGKFRFNQNSAAKLRTLSAMSDDTQPDISRDAFRPFLRVGQVLSEYLFSAVRIALHPVSFVDELSTRGGRDFWKAVNFFTCGVIVSFILLVPVFIANAYKESKLIFLMRYFCWAGTYAVTLHFALKVTGSRGVSISGTLTPYAYIEGYRSPLFVVLFYPIFIRVGPGFLLPHHESFQLSPSCSARPEQFGKVP